MAESVVISELNFYEFPRSCLCLVCVRMLTLEGGLRCELMRRFAPKLCLLKCLDVKQKIITILNLKLLSL